MPASPTLAEADILAALRDCYDPEISLNIVDLGLVQSIAIALDPDAPGAGIPGVPPRHRVAISVILTTPVGSDAKPLIAQIENRLAAFETISRTEVDILAQPAWTPDRIAPEARARIANRLPSTKPAHVLIQIQTQPGKANA
jgi:metal-sulfur cluster biosynthetic enzyme